MKHNYDYMLIFIISFRIDLIFVTCIDHHWIVSSVSAGLFMQKWLISFRFIVDFLNNTIWLKKNDGWIDYLILYRAEWMKFDLNEWTRVTIYAIPKKKNEYNFSGSQKRYEKKKRIQFLLIFFGILIKQNLRDLFFSFVERMASVLPFEFLSIFRFFLIVIELLFSISWSNSLHFSNIFYRKSICELYILILL